MYRIFCESFEKYKNMFNEECYRLSIAKPFELIADCEKYKLEKEKESLNYKKVGDLLTYIKENLELFPRLKAFLWTLESRDIVPEFFGISTKEELFEQAKLLNSYLKLAYWK